MNSGKSSKSPKNNVVIMQPFFIYLRKHFHLVKISDNYVFYDDVQFVRNHHYNRNSIKTPKGKLILTVPVRHTGKLNILFKDVRIDNALRKNGVPVWKIKHWKTISQYYQKSDYFSRYSEGYKEIIFSDWEFLCEMNISLIKYFCSILGISHVNFVKSSQLEISPSIKDPTQRQIDICNRLNATDYYIGNRAKDYMDDRQWQESSIELHYFEEKYPPYPQLYGDFIDDCSIIDLIFNCGPNSPGYIWDLAHANQKKKL